MFITLDCYSQADNSYVGRQLNVYAIYEISKVNLGDYTYQIIVAGDQGNSGTRKYLIKLASYQKLMRALNIPERQWL